jgi:hypothetical protein
LFDNTRKIKEREDDASAKELAGEQSPSRQSLPAKIPHSRMQCAVNQRIPAYDNMRRDFVIKGTVFLFKKTMLHAIGTTTICRLFGYCRLHRFFLWHVKEGGRMDTISCTRIGINFSVVF